MDEERAAEENRFDGSENEPEVVLEAEPDIVPPAMREGESLLTPIVS